VENLTEFYSKHSLNLVSMSAFIARGRRHMAGGKAPLSVLPSATETILMTACPVHGVTSIGYHLAMRPVVSALSLSYRNLEEMMLERGVVDHTTVYRWVQAYAELDKMQNSPKTNERYRRGWTKLISRSKVNGSISGCRFTWLHLGLYALVPGMRERQSLFRKAMNASHNQTPRVINVDKNAVITSSN